MENIYIYSYFFVFLIIIPFAFAPSADINANVRLEWSVDTTANTATMTLIYQGIDKWLGIGISQSGTMKNAEVNSQNKKFTLIIRIFFFVSTKKKKKKKMRGWHTLSNLAYMNPPGTNGTIWLSIRSRRLVLWFIV